MPTTSGFNPISKYSHLLRLNIKLMTVWMLVSKQNIFTDDNLLTRAVESEGFSAWGVGVTENFKDSDTGQTFCLPFVTVCATNVRKRHTWQFKQLDAWTRDDHGYSDRRQRTCIPSLRGHSRSAASLELITQPTLCECNRSGLVSLKFPFAHSGWHYSCSVTLATGLL